MEKLRRLFKVETNYQLVKINIVFAVTGTFSVYFAAIITDIIGLNDSIGDFLYWSLRILLLIPVYQVLLIIVGAIFGEFHYFWKIEKKMLNRIGIRL